MTDEESLLSLQSQSSWHMDVDADTVDPKFSLTIFRVPPGRVSYKPCQLELHQSHLHRMTASIYNVDLLEGSRKVA